MGTAIKDDACELMDTRAYLLHHPEMQWDWLMFPLDSKNRPAIMKSGANMAFVYKSIPPFSPAWILIKDFTEQ